MAFESVEDLAADGVVYAEVRFAPSLLTNEGLRLEEIIEAALAGLARGEASTGTVARYIADAMRHESDSAEIARACLPFAHQGLVGFDLAAPRTGSLQTTTWWHVASSARPISV